MKYDTLIRNALIIDGSNTPGYPADVAILNGRIERIGDLHEASASEEIDAAGRVLAPGFIDVHTHDDTVVIRQPQMLPKLSQGVTTVIVGNCGISASPVSLRGNPPAPMNLLGTAAAFVYPTFSDYRAAVEAANTTLNVAALVGHTALRSNHLDDLFRSALPEEISAMREQLRESLEAGALGVVHRSCVCERVLGVHRRSDATDRRADRLWRGLHHPFAQRVRTGAGGHG